MEASQIVQQAREGNHAACKSLFETHRQKIFALAYNYLRNVEDAEDVVQDTFIKAFQSLPKSGVYKETDFSAWIYRIGVNRSIDLLRKNKLMKNKYMEALNEDNPFNQPGGSNPEDAQRAKEIREKLNQSLLRLSPKQRMIFVLKHFQQLTIKEIAECLDCSEGSIKTHLFRIIAVLRKYLHPLIMEESHEM